MVTTEIRVRSADRPVLVVPYVGTYPSVGIRVMVACKPGERIGLYLARHGIAARSQHFRANGIGTGDLILSTAADDGADLIVMEAYGHARWHELVLGRVPLHRLKPRTVPVLMSH